MRDKCLFFNLTGRIDAVEKEGRTKRPLTPLEPNYKCPSTERVAFFLENEQWFHSYITLETQYQTHHDKIKTQ